MLVASGCAVTRTSGLASESGKRSGYRAPFRPDICPIDRQGASLLPVPPENLIRVKRGWADSNEAVDGGELRTAGALATKIVEPMALRGNCHTERELCHRKNSTWRRRALGVFSGRRLTVVRMASMRDLTHYRAQKQRFARRRKAEKAKA